MKIQRHHDAPARDLDKAKAEATARLEASGATDDEKRAVEDAQDIAGVRHAEALARQGMTGLIVNGRLVKST